MALALPLVHLIGIVTLWLFNIANWKITMLNGKTHYFYSHFQLPEGGHNGSSTLPNSASSGMFGKNFESEGASFPQGCEESSDSSGPVDDFDFEDP